MVLPLSVRRRAEFTPAEDFMLRILREGLPEVRVQSLIPLDATYPMVVVRRTANFGDWEGDSRFIDVAHIDVQCFTEDPDGDADGAILSEAVRCVLRDAVGTVIPGYGTFAKCRMTDDPRRVTDWATSTGPVQYADLPTGVWRYETGYRVSFRKPRTGYDIAPDPDPVIDTP